MTTPTGYQRLSSDPSQTPPTKRTALWLGAAFNGAGTLAAGTDTAYRVVTSGWKDATSMGVLTAFFFLNFAITVWGFRNTKRSVQRLDSEEAGGNVELLMQKTKKFKRAILDLASALRARQIEIIPCNFDDTATNSAWEGIINGMRELLGSEQTSKLQELLDDVLSKLNSRIQHQRNLLQNSIDLETELGEDILQSRELGTKELGKLWQNLNRALQQQQKIQNALDEEKKLRSEQERASSKENERLETQLQQSEAAQQQLTGEKKKLSDENKHLQEQLQKLEVEKGTAAEENARLTTQLQQSGAAQQQLTSEKKQLLDENQRLQGQLRQFQVEKENAEKTLVQVKDVNQNVTDYLGRCLSMVPTKGFGQLKLMPLPKSDNPLYPMAIRLNEFLSIVKSSTTAPGSFMSPHPSPVVTGRTDTPSPSTAALQQELAVSQDLLKKAMEQ